MKMCFVYFLFGNQSKSYEFEGYMVTPESFKITKVKEGIKQEPSSKSVDTTYLNAHSCTHEICCMLHVCHL